MQEEYTQQQVIPEESKHLVYISIEIEKAEERKWFWAFP
jgi:hypothetical protein